MLRRVFATPTPLMAGAAAAGDPIAVVPVLFHLLWCHELRFDVVDAVASGHAGERVGGAAVTLMRAAVLRPGDWVRYDGADHQVIALAGTSVRLRSAVGAESVVLVAYLMASPDFAVIDGAPTPSVEPFGLLDSLPVKVLEQAREWERHIVEVETGLPPGALPGATPRAGFDPASTTIAERDQAKAAELGVSLRTVKTRRARYTQQGLWGLVDQRAVRLTRGDRPR